MTRPDVVFVRMLPRPVPRVARMIHYAEALGLSTAYIGAHREAGLKARERVDGVCIIRVGSYLPSLNGRGVLLYLGGILNFNLATVRLFTSHRPRAVHCSDLETMPAALIYRLVWRTPIIYNVHDNYAERYSVGARVRTVMNAVEGLAVRFSNVALVPEPFRRDALPSWCRSKVIVVRNAPEPLDQAPLHNDFGQRPIRIIYAGWIDEGRGIRELVDLASSCAGRIEVQIAGDGDSALIDIIKRSRAEYLGTLSHGDTLEHFRRSDFVAAVYGPSRPINRMAAPNKLAEALALGRPIITNSEVLMTARPEFDDCAVRLPHAQFHELSRRLEEIRQSGPEHYERMCRAARTTYESLYSWDEQSLAMATAYHAVGLP